MKRTILTALAALALAAGTAHALTIQNDHGGYAHEYLRELATLDKAREHVVIADKCYSSCTLYLLARGVCVLPDAVLGFRKYSANSAEAARAFNRTAAGWYEAAFPGLGWWFQNEVDGRLHRRSGIEMHADFGVPPV